MNDKPTLPAAKAFVVQFTRDSDPASGTIIGRIEHLSSGHRARFDSIEEMVEVLIRSLSNVSDPDDDL